jgi:GNAT superfamily N-acetyltransferase
METTRITLVNVPQGVSSQSTSAQPSSSHWQVQSLGAADSEAVRLHLISLSAEDRRLRFGNPVSDEVIARYAQSIRYEADDVFGIYADDMQLIGLAHLAYGATGVPGMEAGEAEIGLSVAPSGRGKGVGRALFARCAARARTRYVRKLKLNYLIENTAMQRLASEAGMEVHSTGGSSDAYLVMRAANAADFGIQVVNPASEASAAESSLPDDVSASKAPVSRKRTQALRPAKIGANRRQALSMRMPLKLAA